jgi:hypothetical protein
MFSQLITLYLTPVVFLYLSNLQQRWESWRRGGTGAEAGAPERVMRP